MHKKRTAIVPRAQATSIPAWLQQGSFADEEVQLYLWAAARCGMDVSHWARNTLNAAARAILALDDDH